MDTSGFDGSRPPRRKKITIDQQIEIVETVWQGVGLLVNQEWVDYELEKIAVQMIAKLNEKRNKLYNNPDSGKD